MIKDERFKNVCRQIAEKAGKAIDLNSAQIEELTLKVEQAYTKGIQKYSLPGAKITEEDWVKIMEDLNSAVKKEAIEIFKR